jgi:hypothetical protein
VFLSALLTENGSVGQEHSYVILRIPNPRPRQDPKTMKKIILKALTSFNVNLRNSRNDAPWLRGSLLIALVIVCLAFLPGAQADPAPETPDPGSVGGTFNTTDGTNALRNVTTGVANAAFGWFSLLSNTDGSFNTGVGAGTLLLNVGDQTTGDGLENTAVGAVALLNNITGSNNTAVGAAALLNNVDGNSNTAVGVSAVSNGMHAFGATAIGVNALQNDDTGSNTRVGLNALIANTTGFNNAAFGVSCPRD